MNFVEATLKICSSSLATNFSYQVFNFLLFKNMCVSKSFRITALKHSKTIKIRNNFIKSPLNLMAFSKLKLQISHYLTIPSQTWQFWMKIHKQLIFEKIQLWWIAIPGSVPCTIFLVYCHGCSFWLLTPSAIGVEPNLPFSACNLPFLLGRKQK